MRKFLIGAAFAAIMGVAAGQASASTNLIANGDFASGDFTDWNLFTTSNGTLGGSPNPQVVMFNVTGGGAQNAAKFNVGEVNFDRTQQGGGIYQDITTSAGLLDFSAAIASFSSLFNQSAGVFSVLLNGVVEATEDLGTIGDGQELMGSLSFSAPVSAGVQQVEILITRPFISSGDGGTPNQYVTDISATEGAVPEPATWAMMLLGFAGLGFVGYRTSRKAVSVAA
jgi:hypothetical protein